MGQILPKGPQREHVHVDPLILTASCQNCEKLNVCYFKQSSLWYFVTEALGNTYSSHSLISFGHALRQVASWFPDQASNPCPLQ